MSAFPARVVAIEDSEKFRSSPSQASCEKLKSVQGMKS